MNNEEFDELLADYLAGELDARQAAAFRAELEASPQRRKLARELQAAAAALEANILSHEEAEQRTETLKLESIALRARSPSAGRARSIWLRHNRLRAVLRYAAVIVLAFGAGFIVRGWQLESPVETVSGPPAPTGEINERYVVNFVEATRAFPESSRFSRSLLVLARK